MCAPGAGSPAAWAERRPPGLTTGPLARLGEGTLAMALAEVRKLRHDHLDIFTRSVQPLLWLFVFGTALRHSRSLTVGALDYRAYLAQQGIFYLLKVERTNDWTLLLNPDSAIARP